MDPLREIELELMKKKALELYQHRLCPHCGQKISLWAALCMVIGSAVLYAVRVRHIPTGKERVVYINRINPQTMAIVHPDD